MLSLEVPLTQQLPRTLAFGPGVIDRLASDGVLSGRDGARRVLLVVDPAIKPESIAAKLTAAKYEVSTWTAPSREPLMDDVRAAVKFAKDKSAQAVLGVGGGSAMDLAKLVAVLGSTAEDVRAFVGIDKIPSRTMPLVCVPTTAGTGSEVSPNAIVLDEKEQLKMGVISKHLVPDAAYVDPNLTLSVPPGVTASTGVDALTHCIEAYTSKFAHPLIDIYALQGIRLIAGSLRQVMKNPGDIAGRSALLLGSLYGGMCLGPVNTGAVHALAYPLGSVYHVAHGVSNAVLLATVMEFNLPAAPERYADVAIALGAAKGASAMETANNGIAWLRAFVKDCGIPSGLSSFKVPESAIESLADAAMKVTRLLDRNIRTVTREDAVAIYRKVYP